MEHEIFNGPFTTENKDDLIIFLIGMRINKFYAVHKWLPVFLSMPSMIKELYTHKQELGFLSLESYFGLRTTVMIQYWHSIDDLLAYSKGHKHLTAWRNFNRKIGDSGTVGIYHETFKVKGGYYESLYANMPLYGLGKAKKHIPVTQNIQQAIKRLNYNK